MSHTAIRIVMTSEQIVKRNADASGDVPCSRVFCLTAGTEEYFPNAMRGKVYTTNGCAARNTPEDAIVQAISEIIERNYMMRLILENITLPYLPEHILQQCETAYNIISYIRSQGYRVLVKDCSMWDKFPVVCVCIIDPKNGRYHTHLGAYPVFRVALERSPTETFQGYDIRNVAWGLKICCPLTVIASPASPTKSPNAPGINPQAFLGETRSMNFIHRWGSPVKQARSFWRNVSHSSDPRVWIFWSEIAPVLASVLIKSSFPVTASVC